MIYKNEPIKSIFFYKVRLWTQSDSNRQMSPCKGGPVPIEGMGPCESTLLMRIVAGRGLEPLRH